MNKFDWGFYSIIITIIITFIVMIFTSGCAVPQRKDISIIAPEPDVQLWQAIKDSNWIVTISILGIAGGVFATLNGQKWGLAVVVSCSVALFMSLAVTRFAWWMALCGLFGSVGLCITSIMSRKRALVEIIKGIQNYKDKADKRAKAYIKDDLSKQSKSTKKIVKKIKEKI